MRRIWVLLVTVLAVTATLFASTASQASTTSVDLSMTGGTVAGYVSAQYGQELPVAFTMKNRGRTATTVSFYFTVTNATADSSDYVCPLISSGFDIFPDSPACEPGVLGAHRSTSAAILVTPTVSSGTVTVTACALDLDGHSDPVAGNDCQTVSIPIL